MELRFCDDCGARIDEENLSSGRAAEVGDYCYCPKCLKAKKKEGGLPESPAQPARAPSTKKLIRPTPGGGSRPGPRSTPARGTPGRGRKRPPSTAKLPGRRPRPSTAKITVPPGVRRRPPSSKPLHQEGEAPDESPGWGRALRSGALLLLGGLVLGYLGLMFLARQGVVSLGKESDAAVQQPPDGTPPEPGAPIAPTELTAKILSATEVELSWKDNSGSETGFAVERREGAGDWEKVKTVARDGTGFRDGELKPETEYAYRVRAEGQAGSSKPSEGVSARTLAADSAPGPKLAAPGGLEAKELPTAGEVQLTWKHDAKDGTSFVVERREAGASQAPPATEWKTVATVEKGETSRKDTGLTAGTKYEYRVRARNKDGESPWSTPASFTTRPAVGPAGELTAKPLSDTMIELTWKGTFAEKGSYFIDRDKKEEGWKQIGELKKGKFTFKDAGLEPNTRYSYVIRALLPGGKKVSKPVTLTTPAKVAPVIVGEVSAKPLSTTVVLLTWKGLPAADTDHTIEYQDKPGAEWKKRRSTRSKEGYHRATRLSPDTEYSFRIRVNSVPPKYTKVAVVRTMATGAAHPAAGELTANPLSGTEIELTWKGTFVEKTVYSLYRKPGAKPTGWKKQDKFEKGAPKLTDTGLKPDTEYTYRVSIAGRAGRGVSKEIKVRTLAKGQKPPPPGAPAAPGELKAAMTLPNRVKLTWKDNSKDETNFDIERAYSSDDLLRVGPTVKYSGTAKKPYVAPAGSGQSFLPGAAVAHNRKVRWSEIPPQLWGKARLVTAYEDSGSKNASKMYVVNVSGPCTVYRLAHEGTGGKKPTWIYGTWKDSGLTCKSVDAARKTRTWHLWKKEFKAAGPVTLACNPSKKKNKSAAPYVFASGQMNWRPAASIGPDRQTYEDTVRIGVQCFYRVRATNLKGTSAFSKVVSMIIPRRKPK